MVFVDTGVWFAFFVPDDADHERIQAWFDSDRPPLLTTDYIIDETLTLLLARKRMARAFVAGRAFFQRNAAEIHYLSPQQINRTWVLFQQRAAAGWSFTDCTSKIVIDDLEIHTAAHWTTTFGNLAI